jgi:hypothetical protein
VVEHERVGLLHQLGAGDTFGTEHDVGGHGRGRNLCRQ